MKLYLDNCVDHRLRRSLESHEVVHARDLGWEALTNGRLLHSAEAAGFDAIITVDKNFRFQHGEGKRHVALVTLCPLFIRLDHLVALLPALETALSQLDPGSFVSIGPAP